MKTSLMTAILAALALSACGGGAPAEPKGPISEERTASFKSMMPEFMSMGKMVKGEETFVVDTFKANAAKFAESSKKPFEHFASDPQGNGDALPVIWQDTAKFKAEEEKFHAAVAKLSEAAQSGDLETIKVTYGEVGASCKSCHDSFRKPK